MPAFASTSRNAVTFQTHQGNTMNPISRIVIKLAPGGQMVDWQKTKGFHRGGADWGTKSNRRIETQAMDSQQVLKIGVLVRRARINSRHPLFWWFHRHQFARVLARRELFGA